MQAKLRHLVLFQLVTGSSSSWRGVCELPETQKGMCFDSCLLAAES